MSERKVLNKYYPPDFDPSKIPRLRLPKNRQYTVRLMAPCNMRCNTCGDYIAKGKKFNARKETVENQDYLGLKIFRFYFKCPRCMAEITFKTDPKNMDYEVEHGATPNFKALKLAEQQAVQEEKDREEDEKLNPMKLLENRTKQSRREMENLEALEDLKELNQRNKDLVFEAPVNLNENVIHMTALEIQEAADREFEAEEQELLAQLNGSSNLNNSDSSDEEDVLPKFGITFKATDKDFTDSKDNQNTDKNGDNSSKNQLKRKIDKLVVVKKKTKIEDNSDTNTAKSSDNNNKSVINNKNPNNLLNLCAYSSSDSE